MRACYDAQTLVVYQAYCPEIADAAVAGNRFVPPFSFDRMTWIKPSFLWMMERSNWGQKPAQERVLAIHVSRAGWEEALSVAVLTAPDPRVYQGADLWRKEFERALVHVQWDPERSIRGARLDYRAIQVGLSRHVIRKYTDEWVRRIVDVSDLVRRMRGLCQQGDHGRAQRLLPQERPYPLPLAIARRLACDSGADL